MIGTEAGRTGCPREVKTAFKLSLAAIAVDVAVWVLDMFVISDSGLEQMRQVMGRHDATLQVAISAGFLIITSALLLLSALKMRAGHNWARLVLTAIGALSAFLLLNSMSMSGFHWPTATEIVHDLLPDMTPGLLVYGAIVLMFLPASNAYFSATIRAK